MIAASTDVAATAVPEVKRDVIVGTYLEDVLHSLIASRTPRILDVLNPVWPSTQLVTGVRVADRLCNANSGHLQEFEAFLLPPNVHRQRARKKVIGVCDPQLVVFTAARIV